MGGSPEAIRRLWSRVVDSLRVARQGTRETCRRAGTRSHAQRELSRRRKGAVIGTMRAPQVANMGHMEAGSECLEFASQASSKLLIKESSAAATCFMLIDP